MVNISVPSSPRLLVSSHRMKALLCSAGLLPSTPLSASLFHSTVTRLNLSSSLPLPFLMAACKRYTVESWLTETPCRHAMSLRCEIATLGAGRPSWVPLRIHVEKGYNGFRVWVCRKSYTFDDIKKMGSGHNCGWVAFPSLYLHLSPSPPRPSLSSPPHL